MKCILLILSSSIVSSLCVQQKVDNLLNACHTQDDDTSKVKTLAALYNKYLYNDIDKARQYALEELTLSKQLNHDERIGNSLYHLEAYYYNYNQFDSARIYYNLALEKYSGESHKKFY